MTNVVIDRWNRSLSKTDEGCNKAGITLTLWNEPLEVDLVDADLDGHDIIVGFKQIISLSQYVCVCMCVWAHARVCVCVSALALKVFCFFYLKQQMHMH